MSEWWEQREADNLTDMLAGGCLSTSAWWNEEAGMEAQHRKVHHAHT